MQNFLINFKICNKGGKLIFYNSQNHSKNTEKCQDEKINIFNPLGEITERSEEEIKALGGLIRCFFLRAVSFIYLFLIGVSFTLIYFLNQNEGLWTFLPLAIGLLLIILAIILFFLGHDINFEKKVFQKFLRIHIVFTIILLIKYLVNDLSQLI